MKLASFATALGQANRVGALLEAGDEPDVLVDLTAAYAACLWDTGRDLAAADIARSRIPSDMRELIGLGPQRFESSKQALEYVRTRLANGGSIDELAGQGLLFRLGSVRFLPVVSRPGKVICAGVNYATHAAEAESATVVDRPGHPIGFAKFPSVLAGHEAAIYHPGINHQLDYEGELALVIGSTTRRISREGALDAVVGYTVFNDLSVRDVQFEEMKKGMLMLGKNFDGGGPLGPYLVTADEVPDPNALTLTTRVNGQIRQHASTADLIFDCGALIEYWSQLTLDPGDVIATGTPSGVGIFSDPPEQYLLKPGDVVEVEIDGLGVLRNRIEKPQVALV